MDNWTQYQTNTGTCPTLDRAIPTFYRNVLVTNSSQFSLAIKTQLAKWNGWLCHEVQ